MNYKELIEYVMNRTLYKAKQVVRQVPTLEVEDVQHDLIEDVLRRLPKFNGSRAGLKTFVCRIIDNKIANLLKSHDANYRGNGCVHESLDDWVHDETGTWVRRDTAVGESRRHAHLGVSMRSSFEQRELKTDAAGVMASLSPKQQTVSAMLRTRTPTEIARKAGLSRSMIYRHIAAIRAVYIAAGLHHYL